MVKRRWKGVCGFGMAIGTFYLWVNFSPNPSPETLLYLEAEDARKEIFSVLPPGKQLTQKWPFALTKCTAERKSPQLQRGAPASLRRWCPLTLCHVFSWVHGIPGAGVGAAIWEAWVHGIPGAGAAIWAACTLAITDAKNTAEIPQVHFQVHYR